MRLVFFSYVYWPEQFLVNELAADLADRGNDVEVVTGLPNYPEGQFFDGYSLRGPYRQRNEGVKILRFPMLPRKNGIVKLVANYLSCLSGAILRVFSVRRGDWAFVFATSPITTAIPAIIWAKLKGGKVCIWLQDLWPDSIFAVGALSKDSISYRAIGIMVKVIYRYSDLILIQSPLFQENLKHFGYKGPWHVVPNWAPSVDYQNIPDISWFPKVEEDVLKIVFAGNIGKAQSVRSILAAANDLKNEKIEFFLVGDGSEMVYCKSFIEANQLTKVHLLGRHPVSEMPALFKKSDVLLVSLKDSPIFSQTVPSKIQAYMAAGKPILGFLNGAGASLIKSSECGLVAAAEDVNGLVMAIRRFANMTLEQRSNYGRNAYKFFQDNFQKDLIVENILQHLERYKS